MRIIKQIKEINEMRTPPVIRERYERLKQELSYLWHEEHPRITKKVTRAASLGDRSENADYRYNRRRLREIDRHACYFTRCLEDLKIVDYSPQQEDKVFFGAWVETENDDDVIHRFRIVGYDEIFGRKDYISIDSPMAYASLKKKVGDLAMVNTPVGGVSWYANAIEYVKPQGRVLTSCRWLALLPASPYNYLLTFDPKR